MTVAYLAPFTRQKFFDNNGAPLAFGQVTSFAAGTNTPIATYTDSTGGTPNANPIILNSRGEANIWLLPNIAYKFLVTDSLGNTIPGYPIDNVVNSQLITLYGGVDTGSVNAYLLTFTASFTAYTDGVVVIWIPSHTNSGSSTININGLGVIPIVNADGSNLSAGELQVNAPAQILIKGGQAILQNPFAQFQSGSFTVTYQGGTTSPTGTCFWTRTGNQVTLALPNIFATSNSTSFSFSGLPGFLQISPTLSAVQIPLAYGVDNSAPVSGVSALLSNGSGSIVFQKTGSSTGWTAAGTKSLGTWPSVMTYYLI